MKEPIIRSRDCNPRSKTFGKVLDYDGNFIAEKSPSEREGMKGVITKTFI